MHITIPIMLLSLFNFSMHEFYICHVRTCLAHIKLSRISHASCGNDVNHTLFIAAFFFCRLCFVSFSCRLSFIVQAVGSCRSLL